MDRESTPDDQLTHDEREERLARIVASYSDRLNEGAVFDVDATIAAHPDLAHDLAMAFDGLGQVVPSKEDSEALGTLGDYTLRRRIARGGMGVVYEAWESSMDRTVALKVLPAGIAVDDTAFQRFCREAKLAGKLSHPNIVSVFGMGIKEDTPHYSMEYVEGETIAKILRRLKDAESEAPTPFGPKDQVDYFVRVARAFADVADGLQHAHSRGVIHRDVKPSNLILDAEDRLRILDFGLARLEGQESLTITGDFLGTPLYVSPEQARRRKIPVDHRTDVYSLGATLYETLTGRPPFKGKDHTDTLSQIIERDPVEPRKINQHVPNDLQTIGLKCLRKDSTDRYGTAEALAQDLRRFARGDPVEARPQRQWERAVRRLGRARWKLAVAGAFVLLTSATGWFAYRQNEIQHENNVLAYEPGVLGAVTKMFAGKFSRRSLVGPISQSQVGVRAITPDDLRGFFAEDGRPNPVVEAAEELEDLARTRPEEPDAHYHLARAYSLLRRPNDATTAIHRALKCDDHFLPAKVLEWELDGETGGVDGDAFRRIASEYERTAGWQRLWLRAYESMRRKEWSEAALAYEELIKWAAEKRRPFIGFSMEAYMGCGVARMENTDFTQAQWEFVKARVLAPSLEPSLFLAKALHLEGQKDLAHATFQKLYDGADPDRAEDIVVWIVAVCDSLGDHRQGLAWARKLHNANLKARLAAYFLFRSGNTREAIAAGESAIEMTPQDLVAHLVLGQVLLESLVNSPPRDNAKREARLEQLLDVARTAMKLDKEHELGAKILSAAVTLRTHTRQSRPMGLELGRVATADGGYFDNVREVGQLNSPFNEWGPSLTLDGRLIVFQRTNANTQSYVISDLWFATRAGAHGPFGAPKPVHELNTRFAEFNPNISADGLTIFFESTRSGKLRMWVATRATRDDGFGEPRRLMGELDHTYWDANLSADGAKLYFTDGHMPTDLFVATRSPHDEPFTFGNVQSLDSINTVEYGESNSTVSTDERTIFWSEWYVMNPEGPGGSDIWVAARTGEDDDFARPALLPGPVNTVLHEFSPWISYDWPAPGSKLYFSRGGLDPSRCDIFEATWHPMGEGDTR